MIKTVEKDYLVTFKDRNKSYGEYPGFPGPNGQAESTQRSKIARLIER